MTLTVDLVTETQGQITDSIRDTNDKMHNEMIKNLKDRGITRFRTGEYVSLLANHVERELAPYYVSIESQLEQSLIIEGEH